MLMTQKRAAAREKAVASHVVAKMFLPMLPVMLYFSSSLFNSGVKTAKRAVEVADAAAVKKKET